VPPVFISYTHDSVEHKARTHALADRLRHDGVMVVCDRDCGPGGPPDGWDKWSETQAENAEVVLLVFTVSYRRCWDGKQPPGMRRGATYEAHVIRQRIYNGGSNIDFCRVVIFDKSDMEHIPMRIASLQIFEMPRNYDNLLKWVRSFSEVVGLEMPPNDPDDVLSQQPTDTEQIRQGLLALGPLMRMIQEIRVAATQFRNDLKHAKQQLEVLRAYKDLHDGLHMLQIQCYAQIETEISLDSFPNSEEGMDNLHNYLQRLHELAYDMEQVAARESIPAKQTSWIEEELSPALQALDDALTSRDEKKLIDGVALLRAMLAIRPSTINTCLYMTAEGLQLPILVNHLRTLADEMATHATEDVMGFVVLFQQGVDRMSDLSTHLEKLVESHHAWQEVDNKLRSIAGGIPKVPNDLKRSWPMVKKKLLPLLNGKTDPYTRSLQAYAEALENALSDKGVEIHKNFRRFRHQAALVFFKINSALKAQCDKLPDLAAALDTILGMMQ